ncbi:hypothetical protein V8E53_004712 [Lactarius tabidus]
MDIYDIKTKEYILLELMEKEIDTSGHRGQAAWISSGMKIQETQLSLQALVRRMGSHLTSGQRKDITVNIVQDDSWDSTPVREAYVGAEFDRIDGEDDDEHPSSAKEEDQIQSGPGSADRTVDTEHISLCLPSHFGQNWCNQNAAEDLARAELCLREGQLNDSLHYIRIALGHKYSLIRHDIHPACTQRLKTCVWAEVQAIESTVQHHA